MKKTRSCLVVIAIAMVLPASRPALARQVAPLAPTVTAPTSGRSTSGTPDAAPDPRYRLRPGDVIELNFPFVPAFNHTITVQPDGYATIRVVGGLHIAGLTVPELTETLRARYASILRDPVVTVAVQDFEKPYFIVAGEVQRPGKYDLRGVTTVTQAVAIAGGIRDQAKSQAALFRRLPTGGFETKTLDLKRVLNEGQLVGDLRLEPGDTVFIPRGRRIKVSELTSSLASSLWILTFLY